MNILMLTESNFPMDPRVRQEAYKLKEHGHVVSVMAIKNKEQSFYETLRGVRVYRIPKIENRASWKATEEMSSQLLWATRGRTPHSYKSKSWGMIILFWTDRFEILTDYLISNQQLYKYVNFEKGRSSHFISELSEVDYQVIYNLSRSYPEKNSFIILGRNDDYGMAYLGAVYQLQNLIAQAYAEVIVSS